MALYTMTLPGCPYLQPQRFCFQFPQTPRTHLTHTQSAVGHGIPAKSRYHSGGALEACHGRGACKIHSHGTNEPKRERKRERQTAQESNRYKPLTSIPPLNLPKLQPTTPPPRARFHLWKPPSHPGANNPLLYIHGYERLDFFLATINNT